PSVCANDCGARTCAEPFNASASSQYGQLGAKRATVNRRLHNNQTLKNFDRDGDRWSICCFLQNIGKISRYHRTAALDVAIPRNSRKFMSHYLRRPLLADRLKLVMSQDIVTKELSS